MFDVYSVKILPVLLFRCLLLKQRPHFLLVYRRDTLRGMLGTRKLVNHEPKASDLQAFRVISQHSKWVITPVNP